MSKRSCNKCYYQSICCEAHVCDFYDSIIEDEDNIEPYIEQGRKDFRIEWYNYITQWDE